MRLKPGAGFWRTNSFAIGGQFRRAGKDGKEIQTIISIFDGRNGHAAPFHGCNAEAYFTDGDKGAFDLRHCEGRL